MAPLDPDSHTDDTSHSDAGHGDTAKSNGSANGHANGVSGAGVLTTLDSRLPSLPSSGWSFGPPQRPEILTAKPNPLELLHAVRRRWPLAVGLGALVGTIAAALVWFFVPVRYEAFALLRVSGRAPSILNKANEATEEFAIYKRTQLDLIRSSLVLTATIREPAINRLSTMQEHSDDMIGWLSSQLIIDYPNDAEVLRIAMKGRKPDELTKIVNKVVEKYLVEIVQADKEARNQQYAKIERMLNLKTTALAKEYTNLFKLEAFEEVSTSEAVKIKRQVMGDELADAMNGRARLNRSLADNQLQTLLLQARKDEGDEARPPDLMVEAEMNKDPKVSQYMRDVATLQRELIMEESKSSKADTASIKKLRAQIQKMEDQLEDEKALLRPKLLEWMATPAGNGNGSSRSLPQSLPALAREKKFLEDMLAETEELVKAKRDALVSLEKHSAAVVAKREEVDSMQRNVKDIKAEVDRRSVEIEAQDRVLKLDDAAAPAGSGDAVRKYVGVVFAGILGFGLVVLAVAFTEFQSRRLNSVPQVNDGLGIRVVGELPNVSGRTWRRIKGGKGASVLQALMAERIDGTRTALIHTAAIDPPRVVMVTSAEPREGKTTTATQLAASLARSGRRTLLIDADIRNPGAHRVFEMPHEPGLCELLRGEAERDAVIHPTRSTNLWLLPAGRCDLRSVQALSTSYLGTAIAALCVQFDFIVIDSGPVLKVADPLLVGQHVDGVIMSVLRDVSKVPKVYEATERLRSVGITVLGSVVNGVSDDAARHGVELLMAEGD